MSGFRTGLQLFFNVFVRSENSRCSPMAATQTAPAVKTTPPKKFPPPIRVPTTWCQLMHHVCLSCVVVGTTILAPSELPSVPLVVFMYLYSDAYSAVLHAAMDNEIALGLPGLAKTAEGFQMHHDHPVASTVGVGLYRLFCDTVKIQWVTGVFALLTARWTASTARIITLKWILCAYGTQIGHYWSHVPSSGRPRVIKWLHDCYILLPCEHHVQGHHKPPHNKNFGIVSGLSNPVMNPIVQNMTFVPLFTLLAFLTIFDVALIERMALD